MQASGRPPREEVPIPDAPPFRVYIGKIPGTTTEEDIARMFETVQLKCTQIKIVRFQDTGNAKDAFATFATRDELVTALTKNGTLPHDSSTRIVVAPARERAPPQPLGGRAFVPYRGPPPNPQPRTASHGADGFDPEALSQQMGALSVDRSDRIALDTLPDPWRWCMLYNAIENSDPGVRNFMIHGIDNSGPTTLHGIYMHALSEARHAEKDADRRSASDFCRAYERQHARISLADSNLRPDDQLLCASVAFIRMIDISFNHIYSLEPPKVNQTVAQDLHSQDSSPLPAFSSVAAAECPHPHPDSARSPDSPITASSPISKDRVSLHSSTASGPAAGESLGSLSSDSSVQPNAKLALESSSDILDLFKALHEAFPEVDDSKKKNQLRNEVVYQHPDRAGCKNEHCTPQRCFANSEMCTKSPAVKALVKYLNAETTTFETALVRVKEFLRVGDEDPFLQKCVRESVGCEQQLSRWMHQFKSIHLKVRVGYSSEDRARFVALAVQRCPAILQICEIIMRQGPLRINVRPGPDDVRTFSSIQDLPQEFACLYQDGMIPALVDPVSSSVPAPASSASGGGWVKQSSKSSSAPSSAPADAASSHVGHPSAPAPGGGGAWGGKFATSTPPSSSWTSKPSSSAPVWGQRR